MCGSPQSLTIQGCSIETIDSFGARAFALAAVLEYYRFNYIQSPTLQTFVFPMSTAARTPLIGSSRS